MPKLKHDGNSAGLQKATKRRKVVEGESLLNLKKSPEENRSPNGVDKRSDNLDVREGQCYSSQLSEYERKRLENIERNATFFAELNISEAKYEFNMALSTKSKERGLPRPKRVKPVTKALPLRQSLRLMKRDPEGNSVPVTCKSPQPQEYSHPRKLGPLEMKPCNSVEEREAKEFIDELTVLANTLQSSGQEMRESEESKTHFTGYEKALMRLKIKDSNITKVVPHRIFSMAIHPSKIKTLVFAGDKGGNLGIWDAGSSRGDDGVFLFEPHSKPVSCMAFNPRDCGQLYTCSYDGTVRCCDVKSSTFQEVFSFDEDDDTLLKYFAFGSPSAGTLLAGTNTGYILVIDTRGKRQSGADLTYHLHNRDIKCVDVHPVNDSIFLTSSNDGTVAFWDIRNLKSMSSKLSYLKRSYSTTSAYFSPLTGSQVLSTSMDDYITINEVDASGRVFATPKCCIRHNNHVGRWLTSFRATWDPKSDTYSVVGSMKRPRQIDILSSERKTSAVMHLTHECLNSVNSLNVFHPTLNMLAGGNSSGKVYLWTQ